MTQIITEDDIFKYLIPREETGMDIMQNIRGFFTTVPVNIFKNDHYIIYKSIQFGYKHNMVVNIDHLEQMVLSNMDELLTDEKVEMYNGDEDRYTEKERAELIQQSVSTTFQMLEDYPVNDENGYSEMLFNLNLYVNSWAEEQYAKIIVAQNNILRDGKKYNNRFYKGIEDANAYYTTAYDIVRGLLEGGVDRLSDVIDTSRDSPEEIRRKQEEEDYEVLANIGVAEWDEHYPLARTEMVVIQGGSGAGKTRQAINIGYNGMIEYKKNVLVLSLEQVSTRIWPMFVARHSIRFAESQAGWLADKDIIRKGLNANQTMMKNIVEDDLATNEEYGRVRIEGLNLHANDVRGHLEKVWDDGFHFDIVILDYLGILITSGGSRYDMLTDVVNELKAECKTFKGEGFLALLPNQLTKEAEQALLKGDYGANIGGSETSYLKRGADYVYTVHQSEEMKLANKMIYLVEKVRLGAPVAEKIDVLAYQGQCLYLSANIEEEDEEELF